MLNDKQLALIPLDICVPVQEFLVDYTIVQNNELPFVREFILRLLDLSDMTKDQLGKFMGFSEKEIQVAINQLIGLDEVMVTGSGKFKLTPKSLGYFNTQQENRPKTECLEDIRKGFKFDLLAFSYIKSSESLGNPINAIKLYPSNENISNSAKLAKSAFQRHFHQIHEEEDFGFLTFENPELYKISSFKKRTEKFQRFTQVYGLDIDRNSIEPLVSNDFLSKDNVVALLSQGLRENRRSNNIDSIASFFDLLDFEFGVSALKRGYLDIPEYAIEVMRSKNNNEMKHKPIIGSLTLNENWESVENKIKEMLKSQGGAVNVTWIAPSENYWSKSEWQSACFEKLNELKKVNLELYLPIPHRNDKKTKKSYLRQYPNLKNSLHGYIDGFLTGSEEIVIIDEKYAFVIGYLYQNEELLPIPVGFETDNAHTINTLISNFEEYLASLDQTFNPRDLGKLK